jgi:hypothetical protein
MFAWICGLFTRPTRTIYRRRGCGQRAAATRFPPGIEILEDRAVPAFLAPSSVTPSFFPQAAGDFNGDGRSDLVSIVGSPAPNQAQVWLNNGDGTFQAPVTLTAPTGNALSVFVTDINGDGHQDVLVAIGGTALGMSTFLGNGDGTFQSPINTSFSGFLAGTPGDFNGDGKLDLLGCDTATGAVRVAFGDGTGAFSQPGSSSFGVAMTGFSSAVGDFNGDGRLDLAQANAPIYNPGGTVSYSATVALGNGDGTFQFPTNTGILFTSTLFFDPNISSAPNADLAAGDFNGDGRTDLAVAINQDHTIFEFAPGTAHVPGHSFPVNKPEPGYLKVLFQSPTGVLQAPITFDAGIGPGTMQAVDLNGDGRAELIINGDRGVTIAQTGANGTFSSALGYAIPPNAGETVGDFNGDGKLDLATESTHQILLGNGDGTFQGTFFTALGNGASKSVSADLNGDGMPDLVALNRGDGTVSVLLGRGNGAFLAQKVFPVGSGPEDFAAGDLNGDGMLDLVVASNNGVSILTGNGDGTFAAPSPLPLPADVYGSVAVADFNADGVPDLLVSDWNLQTVEVINGNNHQIAASYPTGGRGPATVVGDFNGDGRPDFAVTGTDFFTSNSTLTVFVNSGAFSFTPATSFPAGYGIIHSMVTADLNGDGKLDLALTTMDPAGNKTGPVNVFLGNGDGTFGAAIAATSPLPIFAGVTNQPGTSLAVGDLNGDGIPDLAVNGNGLNVSLGRGDGSFYPSQSYITVEPVDEPGALTLADFNGDGHLDVTQIDVTAEDPNYTLRSAEYVLLGLADRQLFAGAVGFRVTPPATTTVGMTFTATVSAVDAAGNVVPGFRGSVFLSVGAGAAIPYTFTAADAGSHVFTNEIATAVGAQSVTAVAQLLATGTSTIVATPVNFTFTADPIVTAGAFFSLTVTAHDVSGNILTGYTGTVHFTSSQVGAFLPTDYTFSAPGDAGVHTFASVELDKIGAATITATDSAVAESNSSVTVQANPATFVFTMPPTVAAGTAFPLTLTVEDVAGNVVRGYVEGGKFTSSDPQAVLPNDPFTGGFRFNNGDAGVHTFTTTLKTAGTRTITFTDYSNAASTGSGSIVVTRLPANYFAVVEGPGTAGVAAPVTVTAVDAYGNVDSTYNGTVHFTSTDPQAVLPPDLTLVSGTGSTSATLRTAGQEGITATDAATSLSGTGFARVSPAAAASLLLVGAPGTRAGEWYNVTVSARDAFGNVALGYTGTVHFSSSDPQAVLPADYTFGHDAGSQQFAATLKTAGWQSLTATAVDNPAFTSTKSDLFVVPLAATTLTFTNVPATTAGVAQAVTVALKDPFGNVATGYTGTVHFSSSDVQAILPADYTFTSADAGTRTFTVTLKTAGTQFLTVQDSGNNAFTSTQSGIVVSSAAVVGFAVTNFPATTAGVAHTFAVAAHDAFGNVVTGYTGTVTFRSSDVQAGLLAAYTFTAADAGVHTFTATLKTAGNQSITVQDAANAAILGSETGIAVTAAALDHFTITAPTSATQGKSVTVTVAAVDAYGNVVTGYRGKVHFSSTDTKAGLPSDYTFGATDNGVHTFSVSLNTLGLETLLVTDASNNTVKGSAVIKVVAQTSGGTGGGAGGGTGGGGTSGGGEGG